MTAVPSEVQQLLFDPQTSGGLLAALNPQSAERACELLLKAGCSAMRVGEVVQ